MNVLKNKAKKAIHYTLVSFKRYIARMILFLLKKIYSPSVCVCMKIMVWKDIHQIFERLITTGGRDEEEKWNIKLIFYTCIYLCIICLAIIKL